MDTLQMEIQRLEQIGEETLAYIEQFSYKCRFSWPNNPGLQAQYWCLNKAAGRRYDRICKKQRALLIIERDALARCFS